MPPFSPPDKSHELFSRGVFTALRLQGSVLADYELGRIIGTGSFGRVHIARHKQSSGTFVIKALSKAACIKDGQVREH